ncbi:hypothetical protein DFH09DRAFT_1098668 [Mycena vulgaris]|nr:hypothetical protein DFH09DRAFT_1098668 [Mycena vulgaris]
MAWQRSTLRFDSAYGPQLGQWTAKLGGRQGTAGRGCYIFGGQPFEPREQYRGAGALQPPANRVGEAITVGQTHGVLTKAPYAIEKTRSRLADVRQEVDLEVLLEPYTLRLRWESNTKGGNRSGIDIELPYLSSGVL